VDAFNDRSVCVRGLENEVAKESEKCARAKHARTRTNLAIPYSCIIFRGNVPICGRIDRSVACVSPL
jgi:hypothetical protein